MTDEGLPEVQQSNVIDFSEIEFGAPIGEGSYASVFTAKYLGTPVAIKKINEFDESAKEELERYLLRERAMTKFHHPNLIQFIGICEHELTVYLITEIMHGGDLWRYLNNAELELPWGLRCHILLQIARGMAFLHSKSIMHRDLKSQNILVGPSWNIKICDFGFARRFERGKKRLYSCCGTEDWMAPELILGMEYDASVDVFSFGIVVCEVITRKKATDELQRSPMDCFGLEEEKIKELTPDDCPPDLLNLAVKCCAYEPADRPSFVEIVAQLHALCDSNVIPNKYVAVENHRLVYKDRNIEAKLTKAEKESKKLRPTSLKETALANAKKLKEHNQTGTRFEVFKRSPSFIVKQQNKQLNFGRSGSMSTVKAADVLMLLQAHAALAKPSCKAGWLMLQYDNPRTVSIMHIGIKPTNIKSKLDKTKILYIFIKTTLPPNPVEIPVTILVRWIGPEVSEEERASTASHLPQIESLLAPINKVMTITDANNFILRRIKGGIKK